jgi:hypothetical protein
MKNEIIQIHNEVTAFIAGDQCLKVTIHDKGIVTFSPEKVTEYLKRGFSPRHAVSACIGWRSNHWDMNEDAMMLCR